jgi:hypothetical protein
LCIFHSHLFYTLSDNYRIFKLFQRVYSFHHYISFMSVPPAAYYVVPWMSLIHILTSCMLPIGVDREHGKCADTQRCRRAHWQDIAIHNRSQSASVSIIMHTWLGKSAIRHWVFLTIRHEEDVGGSFDLDGANADRFSLLRSRHGRVRVRSLRILEDVISTPHCSRFSLRTQSSQLPLSVIHSVPASTR